MHGFTCCCWKVKKGEAFPGDGPGLGQGRGGPQPSGLVTLATHEEAPGEVWHVPSAETTTTPRFVETVFEQAGGPVRVQVAPRLTIPVLALFNPTMRAVREVLYQSERPWGRRDHRKYASAFGASPTPHAQAIAETLSWFREAGDAGP